MAGPTRLLQSQGERWIGAREPVVTTAEEPKAADAWAGRRVLRIRGRSAFELSYWCGTCQLLFGDIERPTETLSLVQHQQTLRDGFDEIDENVLQAYASLVPYREYFPVLLDIEPTLTQPGEPGDYFAEDARATWGEISSSASPYYRLDTRSLGRHKRTRTAMRLFEFVVPMVPPTSNDRSRVRDYEQLLRDSSRPTAVSFTVLDVRQQFDWATPVEGESHFGLIHFLLDGHHKMEAAARAGRRLRLLSLISTKESLAERRSIEGVISTFGRT